jgi:hypothetical protein
MQKYLFTDGTNGVREVQSDEDLQKLIQSSGDTGKIRIWVFNTNEWITYTEFSKQANAKLLPLKKPVYKEEKKNGTVVKPQPARGYNSLTRLFAALVIAVAIFLVYNNFTRIKWSKAPPLEITAARPDNVPVMNIDSLIAEIEYSRGQKIDKVTATNLRIRNTWPDRIQLQLKTNRDTSQDEVKYYSVDLSIDNSTGYNIDQAVIELNIWKNSGISSTDTFHFKNIGYAAPAKRSVEKEFRGDSLSVSFLSLRSKAFNFCYAAGKESNYGNLNDRWFCRE